MRRIVCPIALVLAIAVTTGWLSTAPADITSTDADSEVRASEGLASITSSRPRVQPQRRERSQPASLDALVPQRARLVAPDRQIVELEAPGPSAALDPRTVTRPRSRAPPAA